MGRRGGMCSVLLAAAVVLACVHAGAACRPGQYCPTWKACSLLGCSDCAAGQFSAGDPNNATSSKPASCTKCDGGRYAQDKGASSCQQCAAGQYSGKGASSCRECPDGHISSRGGESECSSCPAGQHSDDDHVQCEDCAGGQYSNGGAQTCTDCEAGQHSSSRATQCENCDPGQYSSGGAQTCTDCEAGQFSHGGTSKCTDCKPGHISSRHESSCRACKAGQHSDVAHTQCEDCAGGQYSSDGAQSCTDCKAGQHSSSGAPQCENCDPGQYSSGGAQTCTDCEAGQFSHGGTSKCTDCRLNTYAVAPRQSNCKSCPDNSKSPKGSKRITACQCKAGYYGSIVTTMSNCTACAKGTYTSVQGKSSCSECSPGRYQDNIGQSVCKACERGKDACSCRGERNNWPRGRDGLCTRGPACQSLAPCREGATCTPKGGNNTESSWEYSCDCNAQDLFGQECEQNCLQEYDPKRPYCFTPESYCIYKPDPKIRYECHCPEGWSGRHCELMDPCAVLAPCRNGAHCNTSSMVSPYGGDPGYSCDCPTGFSGQNCTILTVAWDCSCNRGSQVGLLITSAVLMASYTGAYCFILQAFEKNSSGTLRTALSGVAVVVLLGCLVLAITAAVVKQECDPGNAPRSAEPSCTRGLGLRAFEVYTTVVAMCTLQSAVACGVHVCSVWCFPNFARGGTSRLLRGAGYPLLAVLLASLGIAAGVLINPDRLHPPRIDRVADILVIYGWDVATFWVLLPLLPIAIVVSRTYLQQQRLRREYLSNNEQDDPDPELRNVVTRQSLRGGEQASRKLAQTGPDYSKFLWDCGVPNPIKFLRAEYSFAALSGLLLPFFWNAHLANELQELLTFANAHKTTHPEIRYTRQLDTRFEFASVDGVRSLSPVVCSLNFIVVGWMLYMIVAFPAPQMWTPSMYFGVSWCSTAIILLLHLNFRLIMSLSESSYAASKREMEIIWGWGRHGNIPSSGQKPSCWEVLKEVVSCLKTYTTSWSGQTAISGANHLFAIVFFSYGVYKFGPGGSDVLSPELITFLWSGISLTVVGVVTSATSYIQRRFPHWKYTPTDDSFRVACVLKALLVMNKALIVYELSKLKLKTEGLERWTLWVTAVCVLSVFILGLLTYAFDASRVYRNPSLVENVGVADGRKFIRMYSLSFFCCKIATVFFILLGHIPDLSGCKSSDQYDFQATKDEVFELAAVINCTLCFPNHTIPNRTVANDAAVDDRCEPYSGTSFVVHACRTDCATMFFSGIGAPHHPTPIMLDVFVLVPILWLPFAVYSNNEVARMIDGIWQGAKQRETTRSDPDKLLDGVSIGSNLHSSAKVGLSTSAHGYNAIVNLSHAIFLLCFMAMLWFLYITNGRYNVHAPDTLQSVHPEFQRSLDKAGTVVTVSVVSMNLLMLWRLLYEQSITSVFKRGYACMRGHSEPLLSGVGSAQPQPAEPEPEPSGRQQEQQAISRPASPTMRLHSAQFQPLGAQWEPEPEPEPEPDEGQRQIQHVSRFASPTEELQGAE